MGPQEKGQVGAGELEGAAAQSFPTHLVWEGTGPRASLLCGHVLRVPLVPNCLFPWGVLAPWIPQRSKPAC